MSGVTTSQRSVRPAAKQPNVTVIEHRGGVQQHLEDQDGDRWRAERGHHPELDHHGQDDLDRMEAQPGRDVEFEVRMVHPVQPPEQRHRVEQHVLKIDREIEADDRCRHFQPTPAAWLR